MKNDIAPVKNIQRLSELAIELQERPANQPGIATVTGESGVGKSTGLTWLTSTKIDACYVRAMQVWSPSSMLGTIARELDVDPANQLAKTCERIVQELARTGRTLLVDEADYVVDNVRLINTLRDLHDMSTVPLVLVGMSDFAKKLRARIDQKQFTGRVAFELEFTPLDLADMRTLVKSVAEVAIDDDLLKALFDQSKGITRLACVGLGRIEAFAKKVDAKIVTAKMWGDRPLNAVTSAGRAKVAA